MAAVRLPIRFSVAQSGTPNLGIVGTTAAGAVVGTETTNSGLLNDSSDVTHVSLVGDALTSQGCGGVAGGFGLSALGGRIPINSTFSGARIFCRLRKSGCSEATVSVFSGATSFPSLGYLPQFTVSGDGFNDYNLELEFLPQSILPGTPWTAVNYAAVDNVSSWGLVAMTECSSGGSQTIDVSEAYLEVDVVAPTPVVVTGSAQVGVGAASITGTLNPNQQQCVNFGLNGFVSTLFPVSWQFYFGTSPSSLSPLGSPEGAFICGPPNNNATPDNIDHPVATSKTWAVSTVVKDLTPGTTYYYALAAIVDDTVTMGSTLSFQTLLTDPSFGAF